MSDNEVSNTQGVAISHDLFGLKAAAEVYRSLSCAISGVSPLNEEFLQYISKTQSIETVSCTSLLDRPCLSQ